MLVTIAHFLEIAGFTEHDAMYQHCISLITENI